VQPGLDALMPTARALAISARVISYPRGLGQRTLTTIFASVGRVSSCCGGRPRTSSRPGEACDAGDGESS
jgi:hypothetical protein